MKRKMFIAIIAQIFAVLIAGGYVEAADKYTINFSPRVEVGKKYRVHSKVWEKRTANRTMGGETQPVESESIEVRFSAVAEILAVDSKGQEIKTSYTVESCTRSEDGSSVDVVPSGTVILSEFTGGRTVNTVKGVTLDEVNTRAVDLVVTSHEPDSSTDQDIWGNPKPVAIGQKWSVDRDVCAEWLSSFGKIVKDQISGTTTFVGFKNFNGNKCYDVKSDLKVVNLGIEQPGVTVDEGVMTVKNTGIFAVEDIHFGALSQTVDMNIRMKMHGKGENDEEISLTAVMEHHVESTYEPLR